jgi:hemoglobin
MRRTAGWSGIVLGLAVMAVTGCASMREGAPAERSLYQRLGGREGIAGVVDDFVVNALADARIGPAFKAIPAAKVGPLKSNIADFICDATGGPCAYLGRSMKESHKGLALTKEDVDACNMALDRALDKNKVAAADKAQVMKVVQGLMPDLVGQ